MRGSWVTSDLAVLGDGGVELERGDAELERVAERRERVLRPQPAAAAMGLEVEAAPPAPRAGRQARLPPRCGTWVRPQFQAPERLGRSASEVAGM